MHQRSTNDMGANQLGCLMELVQGNDWGKVKFHGKSSIAVYFNNFYHIVKIIAR